MRSQGRDPGSHVASRVPAACTGRWIVGPFLEHGAIEPFDLVVGLGPVGPGLLVRDVFPESLGEQRGAIAGAVVLQDSHWGPLTSSTEAHAPAQQRHS